jgi:hypothetical protein
VSCKFTGASSLSSRSLAGLLHGERKARCSEIDGRHSRRKCIDDAEDRGTALVLEEFGNVIARGGSGVVIASQSGHRLPPLSVEQNAALATTPVDELLQLPMLQSNQINDSLYAYQISKRGNSLRVMAEAVRWGKRGAWALMVRSSPGAISSWTEASQPLTGSVN